jgi:serine/threonine protein kinase
LQLGRYQIVKHLATGGVADVLLARATGMEGFSRHVVIKKIRPDLAREERLVKSFLDEARISATLHHHNIVQVHDIGEHDGAYFFAMEYVHGEDARTLLSHVRERGQQIPLDHVIAIVTSTAAGLHHAHEQRTPTGEKLELVHRDVSPSNILIGYDGGVKLVDFGLAKAALRSTSTAAGVLKFKAAYMSPEQCCGRLVDRRTDTFALGIVLYELATARRLFQGANEFSTMAAIVEGTIPPPSAARGDIPPALDAIVMRALARAPEDRYQTAAELRDALEGFAVANALRISSKSLADYLAAQFGPRPEPWQVANTTPRGQRPTPATGVATPISTDAALLDRHGVRKTAPIVFAQAVTAGAPAEWCDDDGLDQEEPTRLDGDTPAARQALEDASTVIGSPPVFEDEDSTTRPPVPAELEPTKPAKPSTLVADRLETESVEPLPPPKTPTDAVYVGPPAPHASAVGRAIAFTKQYPLFTGAVSGFLAMMLTLLAVRACGG